MPAQPNMSAFRVVHDESAQAAGALGPERTVLFLRTAADASWPGLRAQPLVADEQVQGAGAVLCFSCADIGARLRTTSDPVPPSAAAAPEARLRTGSDTVFAYPIPVRVTATHANGWVAPAGVASTERSPERVPCPAGSTVPVPFAAPRKPPVAQRHASAALRRRLHID